MTVTYADMVHSARNLHVPMRNHVTIKVHRWLAKYVTTMRELRDNLMAIMWDESLIMPLRPPTKRRRTTAPQVSQ